MSLATDANKLLIAIQTIASCAESYANKHQNKYILDYASLIKPLVTQYEIAIKVNKSKDLAKLVLTELAPIINAIGAASSKGEMDIFDNSNTAMQDYSELHTIFRELKYVDENL